MNRTVVLRRSSAPLGLVLAVVLAQTLVFGQQKPYEPEVGQAGKDVVWVPTPQALVDQMLDMAKVTPADYVIDLGSGDGRTVITAAKRGARAKGVEFNPDMVELSRRNAREAGVEQRATFERGDIFQTDYSQATVITLFLLPDLNIKLRPSLLDMKPGTRVVSNSFTMGDWQADDTRSVQDNCSSWCTAYLWIVPAKVTGRWALANQMVSLTLTQTYQTIAGTLGQAPISDGKLRGDEITFTVGNTKYTGTVAANAMRGTMSGGQTGAWSATRQ